MRQVRQSNRIITGMISFIFAICIVISLSYDKQDNWALIVGSKKNLLISIVIVAIIMAVTYFVLNILYDKLRKSFVIPKECRSCKAGEKIFDVHPIVIPWLVLIVLWLPNYILYFPGCITYDIIRQYEQFFSGNLTNHHPVLTTLFESLFLKFGRMIGHQNIGIALYLLFTLLLTSGIFAICFLWMYKKKTNYWIRFTALAFYGLFPIWSAYARTAVKDTLFYPIFVLFLLNVFEILLESDTIFQARKKIIGFALTSILLCLVRHNGIYVVVMTMPFCIILVKKYRKQLGILLLMFIAFWEIYQKAVLPMAGVTPGGKQEMLSIPFQQTARYVKYHKGDVSSKEEDMIRKVLNYDTIGRDYNPDLSDPVKNTYTQEDQYLSGYFKVWFEMLRKHPATYIQATLNGTYGYWGYMTEVRYPYGYYVQPESMDIYQQKYKIEFSKQTENMRNIYHNVLDKIYQKTPLTLLTKPMTYLWILVVLLGMILCSRKIVRYWVAFIPVMSSFLICLASPVNGDMRYMLPITASTMLYLAFVSEVIYKEYKSK